MEAEVEGRDVDRRWPAGRNSVNPYFLDDPKRRKGRVIKIHINSAALKDLDGGYFIGSSLFEVGKASTSAGNLNH